MFSCQEEDLPSDEKAKLELPDEIIIRKDYSCYCTVCECALNRVKDAIQHAKGKRHKKASMMKNGKENNTLKRLIPAEDDDEAKKPKTEETEEEKRAKEMLSKVFDETFHSGVVALADNYYCKVCRCMIGNNRKNVNQHKEGKSHKLALEKFKTSLLSGTINDDIPVEDPGAPPFGDPFIEKTKNAKRKTVYYCKLCDFRTKEHEAMEVHSKDESHVEKVQLESGLYAEEYSNESVGKGYQRWSSFGSAGYYNRIETQIHTYYQHGITQSTWNQASEELVPNEGKHSTPPLSNLKASVDKQREHALRDNSPSAVLQQSDKQMGPVSGSQQVQASFLPHAQQGAVPFMPQSQQMGIPFMPSRPNPIPFLPPVQIPTVPFPQPQQAPFPVPPHIHSQQNMLQAPVQIPESTEESQMSAAASYNLAGFITSETDAELVLDVINSLLQTYLKFRLQTLPGSLIKLLRKSSKGEESVSSANKDVMNKITNQISQNTQSHKLHKTLIPEDKSMSSSVPYSDHRSSKEAKKEPAASPEPTYKTPMDNVRYGSYKLSENDDSYDHRSYIEDQLRRAVATRSTAGRQNEDSTSKKAKQIESSIVDFIKQCRASVSAEMRTELSSSDLFKKFWSSGKEKAMRNFGQTESSASNIHRYYSNSNSEKYRRHQTESTISDSSKQYNKREDKPYILRNNESSSIGSADRYSKSSGIEGRSALPVFSQQSQNFRKEDTQSVLDLFRKYRDSGTYS